MYIMKLTWKTKEIICQSFICTNKQRFLCISNATWMSFFCVDRTICTWYYLRSVISYTYAKIMTTKKKNCFICNLDLNMICISMSVRNWITFYCFLTETVQLPGGRWAIAENQANNKIKLQNGYQLSQFI